MQPDDAPTMAALIGAWRTAGEMFGDDGHTVLATIEGSDIYKQLDPTVVHHVDVVIDGTRTRALEIFEPYDACRRVFPTRAYDDNGGVETSTAVGRDMTWTFRAGAATAELQVAKDGSAMQARWTVPEPDGGRRLWMELHFTRQH